jgi:hypothetical protein
MQNKTAMVSRTAPWSSADVVVLAGAGVLGVVLLVVSWIGTSARDTLAEQTGWIGIGIASLAAAALGGSHWLLQGRRAVGRRRRVWMTAERARRAAARRAGAPVVTAGFVAGAAMTRYHRPHCPLVAGKPVAVAARGAHEQAGRRPCGVCQASAGPGRSPS